MLEYYGLQDRYGLMKEWYDGYRFGNADVYCSWDVINYTYLLRSEPDTYPEAFWINSSGNAILKTFLRKATEQTQDELKQLVNNETVTKKISTELTYQELYDSIDNLWGVIFTEQIFSWFQEEVRKGAPTLDTFCEAFQQGGAHRHIKRQFTVKDVYSKLST